MKILILTFSLLFISFCKEAPIKIEKKLFSPDSSKIVVSYVYDYGALGQSNSHTSIINRGENIPSQGNFIQESYPPKMEWISNDSLKIGCNDATIDEMKEWAKPKFKGITLIYYNFTPPFRLHKKYYFSNYKIAKDSLITFKSGLWNFIYYLKSDEDYTFPIKCLEIKYKNNEIESIEIKDDIIFRKVEEVIKDRKITISYIPKFDLIPSNLSDEELNKLKNVIQNAYN